MTDCDSFVVSPPGPALTVSTSSFSAASSVLSAAIASSSPAGAVTVAPGDGSRPANCSPPAPSSVITPPMIPAAIADRPPPLRSGAGLTGSGFRPTHARRPAPCRTAAAYPGRGQMHGERAPPPATGCSSGVGSGGASEPMKKLSFSSTSAAGAVSSTAASPTAGLRIDRRRVRDRFGRWPPRPALARQSAVGGLRLLDPRDLAGFEFDGHRLLARLRMPYLRRLYHERAPLILVETIDAGTPPQRRLAQSGEINRKRGRVMARPAKKFEHGVFIRRFGRKHTPARDSGEFPGDARRDADERGVAKDRSRPAAIPALRDRQRPWPNRPAPRRPARRHRARSARSGARQALGGVVGFDRRRHRSRARQAAASSVSSRTRPQR